MRRALLTAAILVCSLCGPSIARSASPCSGCYSNRSHYSGRVGPYGVPAGRAYYQGKYYGNFNNRFYGPQYGYF